MIKCIATVKSTSYGFTAWGVCLDVLERKCKWNVDRGNVDCRPLEVHSLECWSCMYMGLDLNTLRPRQDGRHFPDDIFKHIFFNENVWISITISLKFIPKGPIYNIPALVQIMAWRRPGYKPFSEPVMDSLPMHICVTWPQWVNHHCTCWWPNTWLCWPISK